MKNKTVTAWLIYAIAIIITIFGLIAAPGCTKILTAEERMEKMVQEGRAINISKPPFEYDYYLSVRRFEYDGHIYIMFGYANSQTIVHDPDCTCYSN